MIGTSISFSVKLQKKPDTYILVKESWHKVKNVVTDDNINIAYSYHDSYEIKNWTKENVVYVLEGCIYNMDSLEIEDRLFKIAQLNNTNIKNEIASFVKEADGDYLVSIYNTELKKLIVFNDILGGMAVNYAFSNNSLQISRSLVYVMANGNYKRFSRKSLSEFVTFGYNVGKHTFFEGIRKMTPGSCIISKQVDNSISIEIIDVVEPSFALKNQFRTKKEAINTLCKEFVESCHRRVEYAKKHNYEIVNTMSGGYDSRTILGGIEKMVSSYTNLTYEYKQDESNVAKKILKHVNSKSSYVKLSFENIPKLDDSLLAFETDGKISPYTNSICYNDLKYGKHNLFNNKKIFYFGGFGGEYIRHPYKPFLQSPINWSLSFSPSVKLTAGIFHSNPDDVASFINEVSGPIMPYGKEAVTKFFYNEYYQNLVRCSGEERMRLFYYTVQPMMSSDFILTIRNRIPLKWAGFRFYTDFLKEIDKRLVEIELFGNAIDIKSRWSLLKTDIKKNIRIVAWFRYMKRKYTNYEYHEKASTVDFSIIKSYYDRIADKDILDIEYLESIYKYLGGAAQLRVLVILEFVYECEKYWNSIRKS